MPRLLHRFRQRYAAIGSLSQIAWPQSVRRKLPRLQLGKFCPLLDDFVDGLRIDRAFGHIAPAVDGTEYAAHVDAGCFEPGIECLVGAHAYGEQNIFSPTLARAAEVCRDAM